MSERHPSGYAPDYVAYGYDGFPAESYQTAAQRGDDEALFGTMPGYGYDTGAHPVVQPGYDTGGYLTVQPGYDTGAYPVVQPGYDTGAQPVVQPGYDTGAQPGYDSESCDTGSYDANGFWQPYAGAAPQDDSLQQNLEAGEYEIGPDAPEEDSAVEREPVIALGPRTGSRRRRPAKQRSALLSIAVTSVCAMGVAAVAAATVTDMGGSDQETNPGATSNTDVQTVATTKLDKRLADTRAGAEDFGDRVGRTQERIDLKARQVAEKKKKAAEAVRKEALRPKFMLPVLQHGLSSYYGQSGVNWMSLHSGIDFPVSYGTNVMAATDGTVRTQQHGAYGNMVIVTAPDGTETWYCHLSSARISSGTVQAGDVIAYSGNSGNSTGAHLHFEVRPGGGSAINPLQWLLDKNLDPR